MDVKNPFERIVTAFSLLDFGALNVDLERAINQEVTVISTARPDSFMAVLQKNRSHRVFCLCCLFCVVSYFGGWRTVFVLAVLVHGAEAARGNAIRNPVTVWDAARKFLCTTNPEMEVYVSVAK